MSRGQGGGFVLDTSRSHYFEPAPPGCEPPPAREFSLSIEDGCMVARAQLSERAQKVAECFFTFALQWEHPQDFLEMLIDFEAHASDWSPQLFAKAFEQLSEAQMGYYLLEAVDHDIDQGTRDRWLCPEAEDGWADPTTAATVEDVLRFWEEDCDIFARPLELDVPLWQWWQPMTPEQRAVRTEGLMAALELDAELALSKYRAYLAMCDEADQAIKDQYAAAIAEAKRRAVELEPLEGAERDSAMRALNLQILRELDLPLPPFAAEVQP